MSHYYVIDGAPTVEQWAAAVETPELARRSLDLASVLLKLAEGADGAAFDELEALSESDARTLVGTNDWARPAEPPGVTTAELMDMTNAELKVVARELSLKVSFLSTKAKLLAGIEKARAE